MPRPLPRLMRLTVLHLLVCLLEEDIYTGAQVRACSSGSDCLVQVASSLMLLGCNTERAIHVPIAECMSPWTDVLSRTGTFH